MRILIISTNAVGDFYLSAAAIEPLKRKFPGATVDVLVNASAHFLAAYLPVDQVAVIPSHSIGSLYGIRPFLADNAFDAVFTFFPGKMNFLLHTLARGELKVGFAAAFDRGEWHARPLRMSVKGIAGDRTEWNPAQSYLSLVSLGLKPFGISSEEIRKPLFRRIEANARAPHEATAILHTVSRIREKSLRPEHAALVAGFLLDRGFTRVHMIGIPESLRKSVWRRSLPEGVEGEGNLDIPSLVGALVGCRLFIGVDSFPLHVADAYDVNYLGLFGPTDPRSCLDHPERGIRFEHSSLQDVEESTLLARLMERLEGLEVVPRG